MQLQLESLLVSILANVLRRAVPIAGVLATIYRWKGSDGLTEGWSLGTPEYVWLITFFSVWFVGMNWPWIKLISPFERKAKKFREFEDTIGLAFESLDLIFKNLPVESVDPRTTLALVNQPTADSLVRRLRFCRAELQRVGIASPGTPKLIKDLQIWLEFLRQLKVLVSSGDYERACSWGQEMARK